MARYMFAAMKQLCRYAIEIIGLECGLYCYWTLRTRQTRGSKMAAVTGQKANIELACFSRPCYQMRWVGK